MPTRAVSCTVTSRGVGTAIVRAYDYDRIERPPRKKRCYEVPLYHMTLSAEDTSKEYHFKVIRFGVVIGRRGDYLHATPASQHELIWQDGYMSGKGAWKLSNRPKALVHDGADYPQKEAWGAAGCIEVTGLVGGQDAWRVFNQRVRELSGVPKDWRRIEAHKLIQKNRSFKCVLQPVVKPPLKPIRCP